MWKDDDTLEFEGSLAYQDTEIIENVTVTYQFSEKGWKYESSSDNVQ